MAQGAEPVALEGHANVVSAVAFSPDGSRLISASWDKTVRAWDLHTGKSLKTLSGHEDWVLALAVSKDGSVLSASQRVVRRWSPRSKRAVEVFGGLGGPQINSVAFSADGAMLATGGRNGTVKVWRVGDAASQVVFGGFESWVSCLAVSADHKTMVTGTRGGEIKLFDLARRKPGPKLAVRCGQQVLALAIHPAGDVLASGGIDTTVRLWDLARARETGKLTGHKGVVTALAWSSDGKRIATGERHGQIKVWSYAFGNRLITTLAGHSDDRLGFTVTTLSFSPDGTQLASGSYDKSIKIWTLPPD